MAMFYLTRYFSGYFGDGAVSESHLSSAIENIIRDFAYVGRVEDYKSALEHMSSYLGVDLPFHRDNVTPQTEEREKLDLAEFEKIVARRCPFDNALYDFIEERFSTALLEFA